MVLYTGTIFFGVLALLIFIIFYFTPSTNKWALHLLCFPFIFLGYMWSDFFAYEITHSSTAIVHSTSMGTLGYIAQMVTYNILDTWILILYLFVFVILESMFFFAGYKIATLVIPEVEEELFKGTNRKERYAIGLLVIFPLQFFIYMVLGGIWALLHFPEIIIIHAFLGLFFSIPITMYAIIKTDSIFSVFIAWFLFDAMLLFLL